MSLIVGALVVAIPFAGGAFMAWRLRTLPIRWACPECHHATTPVLRPGLKHLRRRIQWRWCPRCHWGGWSRPQRIEVPVQSLASVLREAIEGTLPRARAFRWGASPAREPVVRFQWAEDRWREERAALGPATGAAHPSGFTWGSRSPRSQLGAASKSAHPSGFRWSDSGPRPEAPVFLWKEDVAVVPVGTPAPIRWLTSALTRHSSGFQWGRPGSQSGDAPEVYEPDFFEWVEEDPGDTFGFRWKQ